LEASGTVGRLAMAKENRLDLPSIQRTGARTSPFTPTRILGEQSDGLALLRLQVYIVLILAIIFDEQFDLVPLPQITPPPIIYNKLGDIFSSQHILGQFRLIDFLVIFTFLSMLAHKSVILRKRIRLASPLTRSFSSGGLALAIALGVAVLRGDPGFGIFFWKNLVLGSLFFFLFLNAFTAIGQVEKLLNFFAWLLWAKAVAIVLLYVSGQGIYPGDEVGRTVTLWSVPAMTFFSLAAVFWLSRASVSDLVGLSLPARLAPFIIAVVVSTRRGAIILLFLALLAAFFLVVRRGSLSKGVVVSLSLVFVVTLAVNLFAEEIATTRKRMLKLKEMTELSPRSNDTAKLLEYVDAFNRISEHPILGVGLQGTFESDFLEEKSWSGVHCGFLEMWLRTGLLGAAAYLSFVIFYVRLLFAHFEFLARQAPGLLGVGILGAIYLGLTVVATPGPFVFQTALVVFLCSGLVVLSCEKYRIGGPKKSGVLAGVFNAGS